MSAVSEPVLDLCGQAARRASIGDNVLTIPPWKEISQSGRDHFRAMAAAVIEEYLRATERRDGDAKREAGA